ncbi:MAG: multicopper oxidase domain-containing protein [Devosia sp.]|uniref:multicopper oxidase domain-containing protein n=1 Tax=Devosia sp. 66-22 TaxID=1895753 RepID=UPI000AD83B10|nr:multicopper oxidase domain-containing protein [Devosia sp. 66-22]MBN9345818.1 multicopper oxidase domain-containing protein [Devosia sp.]
MKRYSKGSIAFLAAVLPLMTASAWAAGDHNHSDASGTVEAPLDIVRAADDLPAPIGIRSARTVKVNLDTVEVTGRLADGTAYHYWTFGAKVPGPFVRVRVGDTVEVTLTNAADSSEKHSVDFHAATAPGGGHFATEAAAGESKSFAFAATKPGLYVYHCAVPEAAEHIANGMYGLILVEPEEPLPAVDREFYVVQGEVYTHETFGTEGLAAFDPARMHGEDAEYYVFNGAAGALAEDPLEAKVGETIRIYFGVGGPNKTASFHVIGEIFDRVYQLGSLTSPPLTDVQTISVPPGGSAIVDLELEEPGDFTLVDHALARASRGLVGKLVVRE